jgi:hypothetical protein
VLALASECSHGIVAKPLYLGYVQDSPNWGRRDHAAP